MAQFLEAPKLREHHGVAQVNVWRRRIEAQLDAQRPAFANCQGQTRAKFILAIEVHRPGPHDPDLALDLSLHTRFRHASPWTHWSPRSVTMASMSRSREPCGTEAEQPARVSRPHPGRGQRRLPEGPDRTSRRRGPDGGRQRRRPAQAPTPRPGGPGA